MGLVALCVFTLFAKSPQSLFWNSEFIVPTVLLVLTLRNNPFID